MRVRSVWALALSVVFVALVPTDRLPASQQQSLKTVRFTLSGHRYALYEIDVGTAHGCPGRFTGVALREEKPRVLWSFNLRDIAGYLAVHGCLPGTSAATIGGTAIASRDAAIWVIQHLHCGASCAGYEVTAFRFSPQSSTRSESVSKEFEERLGLGGIKFAFPRVILYKNNGYKECPSHWTRMIYRWTAITPRDARFILIDAVSYTSQQCYLRHTVWPPDPGQ